MKRFLVISPVLHKNNDGYYSGYTPYIKEMNIWLRHVDSVRVIAPLTSIPPDALETAYEHDRLEFVEVPYLEFTQPVKALVSFFKLPVVLFHILLGMMWASHIHLRCPSNLGLLSSFVQMFFPFKNKTVKYANNWDRRSSQPFSYRLQQMILRSKVFTRNAKVLVYGDWNERSKNIIPFFTASYSKNKCLEVNLRELRDDAVIRLVFVGTITPNKRPLECIKAVLFLKNMGLNIELDLFGDGSQRAELELYIQRNNLQKEVRLRGRQSPDIVEEFYKKAHFLVFLSQSEGWPKVVAEAMWWGCLPITTDVSCVSQMLGINQRGVIVEPKAREVKNAIIQLLKHPYNYQQMCSQAISWSREYDLERFEKEIVKLLEVN